MSFLTLSMDVSVWLFTVLTALCMHFLSAPFVDYTDNI
jgi:hypothetical protein